MRHLGRLNPKWRRSRLHTRWMTKVIHIGSPTSITHLHDTGKRSVTDTSSLLAEGTDVH